VRSSGWGVALAWGALSFVACGGNAIGPGEHASGGTGASAEPAPAIPPPPDPCAEFQIEYAGFAQAGGTCDNENCPAIDCNCPAVLVACSPVAGCVKSVDCAAVCGAGDDDDALVCIIGACTADAGCRAGSRCVIAKGMDQGYCTGGSDGGSCIETKDCPSGERCVAVASDGTRQCIEQATEQEASFSPCNTSADCASGRHCALPDASFLGYCSSGTVYDHCFRDADCQTGLRCVNDQCTDGLIDSPCATTSDCHRGYCAEGRCNEGKNDDFCNLASDCQSKICVFGIRCSSGDIDAACETDSDCLSGRCAGNGALSACTSGALGSKCLDAADCASNSCVHAPGVNPAGVFGACG
jgi:hypothetical protein